MIDGSTVELGYLSYGYIFVGDMGKKIGRLVCVCIHVIIFVYINKRQQRMQTTKL